jgi:3-deoxy-D-manno-octulosonate 8-phosphate phosphatase (KDO 8-P phosphatase)
MSTNPAAGIDLLCLDVDGVMTDGSIHLDDNGVETKRFHVRDGTGLRVWTRLGYQVALITGRSGKALQHRAAELDISHVIQASTDKARALDELLQELSLTPAQTAVLGDDLPDLPMMRKAGYAMAVADAVAEVRQAAAFVTTRPGGDGAVREAVEHLLKAKRRWSEAVDLFG